MILGGFSGFVLTVERNVMRNGSKVSESSGLLRIRKNCSYKIDIFTKKYPSAAKVFFRY